jgi:adenylate cyclase
MRTVSIRSSLLRNVLALVLSVSITVLVVMFVGARRAVRDLSERLVAESSDRAEESLRSFFDGIEGLTRTTAAWSDSALLSYEGREDLERLNRIFAPMLTENPHITSMMLTNDEGFEYVLLRDFGDDQAYEWYNRITWADRGPDAAFTADWSEAFELLAEQPLPDATDYDVRTRPFYTAPEIGQTVWTDPYYFFTTRDAGMTVSTKWRSAAGQVRVVAFDLLLMDLSRFTFGRRPTPNGYVFVMFRDGSLLGLPADERWPDGASQREALRNPEERHGKRTKADQAAVLMTAEDLELPVVAAAVEEWRRAGSGPLDHFRYSIAGEGWWGGFRRFDLSGPDLWIGVVAPEDDFLSQAREQRNLVLGICGLALLVAVLMTRRLARRYSRPLESLAEQSARVRELSLTDRVPVESRLTEVAQLADANAQMMKALESFSRYVPMDLVRELLRRGEVAEIGGRTETLTILFTDIQDFTTVAEAMTPQTLTLHMAEYFSEMLGVLGRENATVDKFIGDAIVAFWGAPEPDPDHAAHAVRAVLGCRDRLAGLNRKWAEQGLPPLPTRFGLSTGAAVVGNVGAPERLNYTVLGDTVNVASRLESLNAKYGTAILATREVVEGAGEGFAWRRIDRVAVKGKDLPVDVFEPLGLSGSIPEADLDLARRYEGALQAYAEGRFEESVAGLESLLNDVPDDGPTSRLLELCRRCAAEAPDGPWDGVTRYDTK